MHVLYPGHFNPVTRGHEDIIAQCAKLFTRTTVAILKSSTTLFSDEERLAMVEAACAHFPTVEVILFDELTIDLVSQRDIQAIVRGIRHTADWCYEANMAQMNRTLCPQAETLWLTCSAAHSYISSTLVRDVFRRQGDFQHFVSASTFQLMTQYRPQKNPD